jgi:hypothetical protein
MSCLHFCIHLLISIRHFQQEIVEASDDAARKYYEETPKEDRSDAAVTAVMRHAATSSSPSKASLLSIWPLPTRSSEISSLKRSVFPFLLFCNASSFSIA